MSSLASPHIQHNSCNWGTFSSRHLRNLIEIFCDVQGVCLCDFHCRPANMNTPLHPSQLFLWPCLPTVLNSGGSPEWHFSMMSPVFYFPDSLFPTIQRMRREMKWSWQAAAASSMQTHFIVAQEAQNPLFMGIWASFKDFYFKWEANMASTSPAAEPAAVSAGRIGALGRLLRSTASFLAVWGALSNAGCRKGGNKISHVWQIWGGNIFPDFLKVKTGMIKFGSKLSKN